MRLGFVSLVVLVAVAVKIDAQDAAAAPTEDLKPCRKFLSQRNNGRPRPGAFTPDCDEEGYYKPVQRRGSVLSCTSKSGVDLSFKSHVSTARDKNCKCAVEQHESDIKRLGKKFVCDALGNFDKVQCEEDTCYCSDSNGFKINGTENPITSFYSMHCGCAVAKYTFQQSNMVGLRFNCDSFGNYDSIQCRGSMCYCVDMFGNEINQTLKHVSEYSSIACPVRAPVSEIQPCKNKILNQLRRTNMPGVIQHSCDDDGFFNLVQIRGSMSLCVSPDGKYLGYPTRTGDPNIADKNCQCAADMYAKNPDNYVAISSSCDKMGNYKPRQCSMSECYCVDQDGNRTDEVDC